MIGIMVVAVIVGYVLLSKLIVTKVLQFHGLKKANIALAIMILIPTWDVILGAPIYAYLCLFESGVKIYKTVDNVEGFYVGEKDTQFEPYEPYKGYKYIEYQETNHRKSTGKYYRSYWVNFWEDTNAYKNCVPPRRDDDYAKAVQQGHCVVKEEIAEKEVSRWDSSWDLKTKQIAKYHPIDIYGLGLSINKVGQIRDSATDKILSEQISISWNMGWISSMFTSIDMGHPKIQSYGIDYSNVSELEYKTLKLKTGDK